MTAAAVRYLGAEVPEPACDAGMLERFMREIYAVRPMPTRTLAKLRFKLFGPIQTAGGCAASCGRPRGAIITTRYAPSGTKGSPCSGNAPQAVPEVGRSAVRPAASARQGKQTGPPSPGGGREYAEQTSGAAKRSLRLKIKKIRPFIAN